MFMQFVLASNIVNTNETMPFCLLIFDSLMIKRYVHHEQ